MNYTKRLPRLSTLLGVTNFVRFPVTASQLRDEAYVHKTPPSVLDFLALFSPGDRFVSRRDFLANCEELELLIREERKMPHEAVLAS